MIAANATFLFNPCEGDYPAIPASCDLGRSSCQLFFFTGPYFFLASVAEEDSNASLPVAASCYCALADCFLRDVRAEYVRPE